MRIFYVLLFGIVIASCSRTGDTSLVPAGAPNGGAPGLNAAVGFQSSLARQNSGNNGFKELYAFNGYSGDGGSPLASLIAVNGELYGTTYEGGAGGGVGTVYKVSESGKESVLYGFGALPDGSWPQGSLVALNGMLYGTTSQGGSGSGCATYNGTCGTVFEVSTSGKERVLYSFKGGTDGEVPVAGLVAVNGELYGTTYAGGGAKSYKNGTYGLGTVFKVSTSGKESVVHRFQGTPDGAFPSCTLIALHGVLYGTTWGGGFNGTSSKGRQVGSGTVFKMNISGKEDVVYNFRNPGDGAQPTAGVISVNNMLYGTTSTGGTNLYGTVYEVSTSGSKERVLSDRVDDPSSLIAVKGVLYGTTVDGGFNFGTAFKISTSGKETVLHDFAGGSGGFAPYGGLLAVNGTLYGTTSGGGPNGGGTLFKVLP
jgi:uncharacterized repeat protein (TIGR03803 family)